MTNDPSGRRRPLLRRSGPKLDPLHSIGALRAIDEQAKLNLRRAVPAVLLALACFSFGDHLGGIDQTRPARFALGQHSLTLSRDQVSLVVTGLTRNGVWLVEDGEVTGAVSNMRFTQSYPRALGLGAVRGIGTTAVPLADRWPGVRYTAPAVRLASWNLTGNASG